MLTLVCAPVPAGTVPLLTDFNVRPEPALPAMGPAGSKIVDPTFGTTILRVTDANNAGAFGKTLYANYPSVNLNSTRVMAQKEGVGAISILLCDLNAIAFTVSNCGVAIATGCRDCPLQVTVSKLQSTSALKPAGSFGHASLHALDA